MPIRSINQIEINDSVKNHPVTVPIKQNDTIALCSDNQDKPIDTFEKQEPEKEEKQTSSMSFGKKLAIGTAIAAGVLLLGELVFYKGKHIKKVYKLAKDTKNIIKATIESSKAIESSKIPFDKQDAVYKKASKLADKVPAKDLESTVARLFKPLNEGSTACTEGLSSGISEIPEGILPSNRLFFHGTKAPSSVIREGLKASRSNQLHMCPREFGEGVYLTPDRKVASAFAGIKGKIIPVKANITRTALVNDEQFQKLWEEALNLSKGHITQDMKPAERNAFLEVLVSRIFGKAGYDSVYTSSGMASGGNISVDNFLGIAQSQLVVFDPKKIRFAIRRTLNRRVSDQTLQIEAQLRALKSTTSFLYSLFKK